MEHLFVATGEQAAQNYDSKRKGKQEVSLKYCAFLFVLPR